MSDQNFQTLLEHLVGQQNEVLQELQDQRKELEAQRHELATQRQELQSSGSLQLRKDPWDRVAAISPIVSAVIIACIGAYFTYTYNLQQLKVQEIQTIEKFIPHLVGDEKSKRAAILAISSLGNAQLAAKVASIFASEGTASALASIAEKSDTKDKQVVRDALYQTLDALAEKYKYENKFDDALETYKRALSIKEDALGKDNPLLAEDVDKLAQFYELHGEHAEAEVLLKRSAMLRKHNSAAPEQVAGASEESAEGFDQKKLPPAEGKPPVSETTPVSKGSPESPAETRASAHPNTADDSKSPNEKSHTGKPALSDMHTANHSISEDPKGEIQ